MAALGENIAQAIEDFDSIKAAIEAKGIEVGGTATSGYADKISQINSSSGDNGVLKVLINRSITSITIPEDITTIGSYAFANCTKLTSIDIPSNITLIDSNAFENCGISSIVIPTTVLKTGTYAFNKSLKLTQARVLGATALGWMLFAGCKNLTTVYLSKDISGLNQMKYYSPFLNCTALEFITLEQGFNANYLNLSDSTKYSVDTLTAVLDALADRTGVSAYTLILGSANLAKLTDSQKAIATDKNWILA